MSNGECAVKMSSGGQGEEVIWCVSRSSEVPLRGGPSIGELAGSRHACAIVLVGYGNCSCTEGQKMEDCEPRSVEKTGLQRGKPQRTGNANLTAKAATYKAATDKPQSSGASLCGRFLQ